MFPLCSFLQSVCQFVKALSIPVVSVTKRMYRASAVILSGAVVVAVMTFTSAGFSAGGRNALAFAETIPETEEPEEEKETEGIALFTEAKLQLQLTDSESLKNGQLLVGNTLAKGVQKREKVRQERRAATEKTIEEIRRIAEERARAAAEEAARKAEEEARRASAVVSYTDGDYQVLQRIVEAEAGICDMKGRILVANVIINRVKSREFPNNITDVVYQKSQFSPVYDGRLNTCRVTDKTVEAVNRALAGEDYSQGALYFMNRRRSRSSNVRWFDGKLTYLFQHDNHEFFR
ncbi:MAG: cell wall hydrolase [Eubacteriales bacterium]|nr:cell wall hydrolase [Eubacteriales bacterium]